MGPIVTMDASGHATVTRAEPSDWHEPAFSPDGSKLAVTIGSGPSADIWIYEAARDLTKFTFSPTEDHTPVWSPDGRRIAFSSDRDNPRGIDNLYWQRSSGTGPVERLTTSTHSQRLGSFHPSGRFLAFTEGGRQADNHIMILPIEGNDQTGYKPGKAYAFVSTPANEMMPDFSPDGRWLAYMSSESGTMEVYVRPFPSATANGKYRPAAARFRSGRVRHATCSTWRRKIH